MSDYLMKCLWKGVADVDQQQDAAACIEALEARVAAADKLAAWVDGMIEDGCPKCGGDCSSANPPVAYCPIREMVQDLAAYQATKEQSK